jgi:prophage antirepressor-like protein
MQCLLIGFVASFAVTNGLGKNVRLFQYVSPCEQLVSPAFKIEPRMIQTFYQQHWNVRTCVANGIPYFVGRDVAEALGYAIPHKAVREHVWEEDRVTMDNLRGSVTDHEHKKSFPTNNNRDKLVYITEPGLYSLVLTTSKKPEAREFKRWVCQSILPHLRKSLQSQQFPPLSLRNESELHYKVVDALRRFYPHAIVAPGLGELQDSVDKRRDGYFKGYTGGQPDLLILNAHAKWRGFALELKNPRGIGKLSEKQGAYLENFDRAGYKTLVSDDYDAILLQIFEYFQKVRLLCGQCSKRFCNETTLDKHMCAFHKLTS